MMSDSILIVDDQREVGEGLALLLKRDDRRIVVCSDVESADLALLRFPFTHVVADVHLSDAFGFEGLEFVHRVRNRYGACTIIVMTGELADSVCHAALAAGADAVLGKPFDAPEIEALLCSIPVSSAPVEGEIIRIQSIDEMLGDELSTVFQPIVSLSDGEATVYGYEALARVEWAAGNTADLFEYAARRKRLTELNLASIRRSIQEARDLPEGRLFLNVDAPAFESPALVPALEAACAKSGRSFERIVLELTERLTFVDLQVAERNFELLRKRGVHFAMDDHGSAYSHLELIDLIQPSFFKMSHTFGTGFELDSSKRKIVRHVVALARDFGCDLILEGIESADTAVAAASFGITYAQGFHFGRPSPAAQWNQRQRCAAA
jgi:EAL domain-containing protein (putative c-di-GMP-specific phosphodiesterase class I)